MNHTIVAVVVAATVVGAISQLQSAITMASQTIVWN